MLLAQAFHQAQMPAESKQLMVSAAAQGHY
jgi:hypothetical protein